MCLRRVVAFGSPKAGNDEFEGSVYATVGRIYRVVNSNDAVSPFKYICPYAPCALPSSFSFLCV